MFDNNDIQKVEKLFDRAPLYDPQALNIFIVPVISDGTNGYQVRCADSYIVMAESHPYNCTKRTRSKFSTILAHEIGHDFGLNHHNDNHNLMFPYGPTVRALTQIQVRRMRKRALQKYPSTNRSTTKTQTEEYVYQTIPYCIVWYTYSCFYSS